MHSSITAAKRLDKVITCQSPAPSPGCLQYQGDVSQTLGIYQIHERGEAIDIAFIGIMFSFFNQSRVGWRM